MIEADRNHSIYQRLLLVEDDFISASTTGGTALASFHTTWATLRADIDDALRLDALTEETKELVYASASAVEVLAESLLDIHTKYDALTLDLQNDLEEVFAQVDLGGISVGESISPSAQMHPASLLAMGGCQPSLSKSLSERSGSAADVTCSSRNECSPCPPYIAPAYRWLSKNFHDPYPSNATKLSIAQSTGTSLKHINAWFMNVRRRMGWTALSKKFYMGSRSETVDAARRALVEEDSTLPQDVTMAFVELKYKAKSLYSDKLKKSVLAGKLDVVVKDMTDEDREKHDQLKAQAAEVAKRQREADREMRRLERAKEREARKANGMARASYPSPQRSSYNSPEPAEDDSTPLETVASHKRRLSPSSEDSDTDFPTYHDRSTKRFRLSGASSLDMSAIGLPSPQSSSEDLFGRYTSDSAPKTIPIALPSSISRKRRLSDADASPTPKRPRGLAVGPRLQAVSDPLPMSSAIAEASELDSWFRGIFEMPVPVSVEELDPSVPLDVELFNNRLFVDDSQPVGSSTAHKSLTPVPAQQIELLDSELRSVSPKVFDLSMFPVSFGDGQFNFQHPTASDLNPSAPFSDTCGSANDSDANHLQTHGTTSSPFDFLDFRTAHALDCQSTPFGETFNMEAFLSSTSCPPLPSLSTTISSFTSSQQSGESVVDDTWCQFMTSQTFPPSEAPNDCSTEALLNRIELPHIVDPSLFMLPPSPSEILAHIHEISQLNAEKQAKLEKLRAHQEAVRKLEAELSAI